MAKRKAPPALFRKSDLAAWNFVIFLTLAFILLVVVLSATQKMSLDLRSRASNACPRVVSDSGQPLDEQGKLMRLESCPGGKIVGKRDSDGCVKFTCELPAKK